jgi:hypothetical protein
MNDTGARAYASSSQWVAEAGKDFFVGAFETREEAITHYRSNQSVVIRRAPRAVAGGHFVWAVITLDDRVDSLHGGDAAAATMRSEEIGGKLMLFLAKE